MMYTLHKLTKTEKLFLGWFDTPDEIQQAIRYDAHECDDDATYTVEVENGDHP